MAWSTGGASRGASSGTSSRVLFRCGERDRGRSTGLRPVESRSVWGTQVVGGGWRGRGPRRSWGGGPARGSSAGARRLAGVEGVSRGSAGGAGRVGSGVSGRPEASRFGGSASSGSSGRRRGRRSPSPSRREKWTLSDPPLSAPQAARGGQPRGRRQAGTGLGGRSGSTHSQTASGLGSRCHGKARQTKSLTPTHALPSLSRGPFHFLYPTQGQPRANPVANPGPTQAELCGLRPIILCGLRPIILCGLRPIILCGLRPIILCGLRPIILCGLRPIILCGLRPIILCGLRPILPSLRIVQNGSCPVIRSGSCRCGGCLRGSRLRGVVFRQ